MTSLLTSSRQVSSDGGYYIPLASLYNKIYSYNTTTTAATFAAATWATTGTTGAAKFASSINAIGAGILRDMGKTVISSGRTFRKVQLVVSTGSNGVAGNVGTTPLEDFLTGYIELGFDGNGLLTPVAAYGR
jgi:hypothetical protein